jgi:hypothetical protein
LSLVFLLLLGAATAADTVPPAWPEGAWLQVGKDQALYDSPATTDAELRRREDEVQLSLYWPAATDDQGVVAYRIFYDQQELAQVAGDVQVWGARVQDGTENWAVVPVDAAGNEGPRLEGRVDRLVPYDPDDRSLVLLMGIRGDPVSTERMEDVFADEDEPLVDLAAAFTALGGGATASDGPAAAIRVGPDNLSIRLGHRGEPEAFFTQATKYLGHGEPSWHVRDGPRELLVLLRREQPQGVEAWVVEVHTQPMGDGSRLSRQVMSDPLSATSLGSCAVDTDYERTGGLWIEIGVDPRGGAPTGPCERAAVPR